MSALPVNAPVTLPVTLPVNAPVKPFVDITALLKSQESVLDTYNIVAFAPSTVKPAPLAVAASDAPLATVMFKSAMSTVVEFTEVVVPLTVKSPVTITFSPKVTLPVVLAIVIAVVPSLALTVPD